MRHFIDYDRATGKITKAGDLPDMIADAVFEREITYVEVPDAVDPTQSKFDIETGTVVDQTAADRLPLIEVVNDTIGRLLAATDFTQIPDSPFTDAQRADWRTYRQALRDLSNEPSIAAMVAAWPSRPDGQPSPF